MLKFKKSAHVKLKMHAIYKFLYMVSVENSYWDNS